MKSNVWKLLAVMVVLVMALSGLAACGSSAEPTEVTKPEEATKAPPEATKAPSPPSHRPRKRR